MEKTNMSAVELLLKKEEKKEEKPAKPPIQEKDEAQPLLKMLKEQIDIFPEFYERLNNIEAKQAAIQELLVEVLALLRSRVSVLDELDKKELELMNSLAKKIGK